MRIVIIVSRICTCSSICSYVVGTVIVIDYLALFRRDPLFHGPDRANFLEPLSSINLSLA